MRTPTEQLRGETAQNWLTAQGQDQKLIDDFWSVFLVSALGESTDRVSMAAARKVFVDGFAAARGACDVLTPPSMGAYFHSQLAGSQYVLQAGGGHITTLKWNASRILAALAAG